jgi:hypothetical protein
MNMPRINLPLKLLVPLVLISIFAVGSFAATVGVTTSTYQGESGVLFNVTGGFTAASNGFAVVQASGSGTTLPATWTNGGTVQTAMTAGRWYYSVTLTMTASAIAGTYTVTVNWNTGSGYSALGSQLTFTVATVTNGQTMTFLFDTGVTTFNAPVGITITVA